MAKCSLCGAEGIEGSEVTYTVAWLCRAPFGCAQAPAASADELAEQAEIEADLAAAEMGMDDQLELSPAGAAALAAFDARPRSRTRTKAEAEHAVSVIEQVLFPEPSGFQVAVDDATARLIREMDPFQLPPEAAECERYIGVDPGLANLGLFVLGLTPTSVRCLHRETFATSPADGTDDQRLALIARHLSQLVSRWQPRAIGYEDVRSITTGKEKAGAGNADRGPLLMVCGMLIAEAVRYGVACYRIANQSARVAVLGKGKSRGSSKASVRDRVQELTGTRKLTLDQGDAGAFAFGAYVKHVVRNLPKPKPRKKKP